MEKTYKLATNIVSERFEDEAIIINLIAGNYYSLRGISFYAWSCLEAGMPSEVIQKELHHLYPSENGNLDKSFSDFISRLEKENLIKESESIAKDFTPVSTEGLPKEFQPLSIEMFTDMQDLLLLDPIHEVEEEKGWPFRKEN